MNTKLNLWIATAAAALAALLIVTLLILIRRRRRAHPSDIMDHIGNAWVTAAYIKQELDKAFPTPIAWRRLYAMLDTLEADGQVVKRFYSDLAGKGHRQYRRQLYPRHDYDEESVSWE